LGSKFKLFYACPACRQVINVLKKKNMSINQKLVLSFAATIDQILLKKFMMAILQELWMPNGNVAFREGKFCYIKQKIIIDGLIYSTKICITKCTWGLCNKPSFQLSD
jgi:uncharacterized protein YbaR (Trm112 family)